MGLQLYMWSGTREAILRRHRFYVEQVKALVLSQFDDISAQAEAYAEREYERLGSMPGDENSDMSLVAEAASNLGQERYGLLDDLRRQMGLGAVAGMYHQWDKELRDFVERELSHYVKQDHAKEVAWDPNIGNVFDVLTRFGWDCRSAAFFPSIDACRLIVNVYKHGKGRSLDELLKAYPQFLHDPLAGLISVGGERLRHEWLEVSDTQFDGIAAALEHFWEQFPERLYLVT